MNRSVPPRIEVVPLLPRSPPSRTRAEPADLHHRDRTTTGLGVSTVHRLVRALCAGGVLVQDARSERCRLGPLLVVLGRRAEQHLGDARALPVLHQLAATTGSP